MRASETNIYAPSLLEISSLLMLSLYIVPVVLSISLFGFANKRKSSDFVMSFPITKGQIFMTNTLGGIIIIILMHLVNYLFTFIVTMLLSNIIIDYHMLFDAFLIWTVSHIFVFTVANIASSVSANKITTIIVTLIVLFFVPFTHTFITNQNLSENRSEIPTYCNSLACTPQKYRCYDNEDDCEKKQQEHIYLYSSYIDVTPKNYTLPYSLIARTLGLTDYYNAPFIHSLSLVKMFILSLIYIPIGLYFFSHRKFEVVETSFKSEKVHIFVRTLTIFPILCIYYILIKSGIDNIFTYFFLLALLMTYIIIYDLITRKKVVNVFKSFATVVITGIIVLFLGELTAVSKTIDVSDIKKINFTRNTIAKEEGYTTNKDIINYIMSIHLENYVEDTTSYEYTIPFTIEVNSHTYEIRVNLTKEEYNYIVSSLAKDKYYHPQKETLSTKNIYGVALNNHYLLDKNSSLYNSLISYYKNTKTKSTNDFSYDRIYNIKLYTYDNYTVDDNSFYVEDKKLQSEIVKYYNREASQIINDKDYTLTYFYINSKENRYYMDSYDVNNNVIIDFIKNHQSEEVDINKDYICIELNFISPKLAYHQYQYTFVTNDIEELKNLLPLKESVKDTEEVSESQDEELTY